MTLHTCYWRVGTTDSAGILLIGNPRVREATGGKD